MCADLTFESQRWSFCILQKSIWPLCWLKGSVSAQCVYIMYSVFCIWDLCQADWAFHVKRCVLLWREWSITTIYWFVISAVPVLGVISWNIPLCFERNKWGVSTAKYKTFVLKFTILASGTSGIIANRRHKYPNSLFLRCGRVKECLEFCHIKILPLKTRVI